MTFWATVAAWTCVFLAAMADDKTASSAYLAAALVIVGLAQPKKETK